MKQVSVIILNWNGARLLRQYLPSVIEHTDANLADIIVADNGSTDNSLQVLSEEFPSVRIIPFAENLGFAEGYNQAITQCETPLVLLLNDDVAVTQGWLEPMVNYLNSHEEVVAVQPKLKSDRNRSQFEYAGAAGGYLDRHGYPFCRGRIFDTTEEDQGQYDDERPIMWATGACLLVRREEYLKAGGLDKHFFAHMEEIDLCWRLRRMGWQLACVPSSVVYHYGGGSLAMGSPRKTMLNFRNSLLMLHKNLPTERRHSVIRQRKFLDYVAMLNFLLHGELQQVKAIHQAHREAKKMIRTIYNSESPNQIYSKSFAESPLFPEERISILLSYYIYRNKKYSQLKK